MTGDAEPAFVIYAPPYDDREGGRMVLHELCDRLNRLGYQASIWPFYKPGHFPRTVAQLRRWLGYLARLEFLRRDFDFGPYRPRLAKRSQLRDAVVIYPEIVAGNPLGAKRVVRWLLYMPGFHTGEIDFAADDVVVHYKKAFDADERHRSEGELFVTQLIPAYRQENFGARSGDCFLVRKGVTRNLDAHPPGAVPVDALSHQQRAAVYNRSERLFSYDLYSFYFIYAAVCGCMPVIVPVDGISETDWYPDVEDRWGLAYGEDRIAWALETRPLLLQKLADRVDHENSTVERFVSRCADRWYRRSATAPAPAVSGHAP